MIDYRGILRNIVYGLAVGDAVGVPYEFKPRVVMRNSPCVDMVGYGTHLQPKGTWSDDMSLTLCLTTGLNFKLRLMNIKGIVNNMLNWFDYGEFTPFYETFDYGGATERAIMRLKSGLSFFECGGADESDNGNGSLMRIAPLSLYVIEEQNIHLRYNIVRNISSLTHRHEISILGCFIYVELLYNIIKDKVKGVTGDKEEYVLYTVQELIDNGYDHTAYNRVLSGDIVKITDEEEIRSTGYVVDTLEAALYSFLTTNNYEDCILRAVNLGDDTDTVASVAGGLAGLYYDGVPEKWLNELVSRDMIDSVIRASTV